MRGGDDFLRFAAAVREAADRELAKEVGKGLRAAAKPIGASILRAGASRLPKAGGLAARVERYGKVGIRSNLRQHGNNPRVELVLSNRGVSMKRLDEGLLRHPVFGNRRVWVTQRIRAHLFTDEFEKASHEAEIETLAAMQRVVDDIARKA